MSVLTPDHRRSLAAALLVLGGATTPGADIAVTEVPAAAIAVDPLAPSTVYASFSGLGVFKTTDAGDSWHDVGAGLGGNQVTALLIHPQAPKVVYAFEKTAGLHRSDDGAASWEPVGSLPPGGDVFQLLFDPADAETLWAATSSGILRITERGERWRSVPFHPQDTRRIALHRETGLYAVTAGGAVLRSPDFGRRWQRLGAVPLPRRAAVRDLVIDAARPQRLFAATDAGLFFSPDGGREWELGLEGPILTVVIDPHEPSTLFAVGARALYKSAEGGAGWAPLTGVHGTALALDPEKRGVVYVAGAPYRVFRSRDGGAGWALVLHERPPPASVEPLARRVVRPRTTTAHFYPGFPGTHHVAALAIDPRSPDTIYAGSSRGIFKSTDFGATWQDASRGLAVADVHALAIDPEEPSIVYAGTHGGGVHRSVDGGRTWRPSSHGLDDPLIRDVAVDPLEPSTVYAATASHGVYLSLDHGRRWQPIGVTGADDVRSLAFDPTYPLRLLAGTAGGQTLAWDFAARAWQAGPLRTAIDRRVFGGLWEPYFIVPEALEIRELALHPHDSRMVYGATAAGLIRGAAGYPLPPVPRANVAAVALDPREPAVVWAGTSRGLVRSANGGASWSRIAGIDRHAAVFAIVIDPVVTSNVYVGLDRGIVTTKDSGETWTAARLPEPPPVGGEDPGTDVVTRAHVWLRRLEERGELSRLALLGLVRSLDGWIGDFAFDSGREGLRDVRLSPDSRWLMTSYRFNDARRSHSEIRLYELEGLGFDPHGVRLLDEETLELRAKAKLDRWALEEWKAVSDPAREPPHASPSWLLPDPGRFLAWSGDGRFMATHDFDRLRVWRIDAASPEPRIPVQRELPYGLLGVDAAAWSSGGALAAAGRENGQAVVHVWNPRAAPQARVLRLTDSPVEKLIFSPDGRWLLTFGAGVARAWDLAGGGERTPPLLAAAEILEAELGPDGRWLAVLSRPAGHRTHDLRIWRWTEAGPSAKPLMLLRREAAEGLVFSPDGRWLGVGGADDRTGAWLWELGAGLTSPVRLDRGARLGSFTPDGEWLALTSHRGTLLYGLGTRPYRVRSIGLPGRFVMAGRGLFDGDDERQLLRLWRPATEGDDMETLTRPLSPSSLPIGETLFRMSPDRRWAVIAPVRRTVWPDAPRYKRWGSPTYREIWLGDLAGERPRWTRLQVGRSGPAGLHPDEHLAAEHDRRLGGWPFPDYETLTRDQLLEGVCRVIGPGPSEGERKALEAQKPQTSLPAALGVRETSTAMLSSRLERMKSTVSCTDLAASGT